MNFVSPLSSDNESRKEFRKLPRDKGKVGESLMEIQSLVKMLFLRYRQRGGKKLRKFRKMGDSLVKIQRQKVPLKEQTWMRLCARLAITTPVRYVRNRAFAYQTRH